MKRGGSGSFETTIVAGESVEPLVPNPLPPIPPLAVDGPLRALLDAAVQALGRLDRLAFPLPEPAQLRYVTIRREAVLSCRIDGNPASLRDLLLLELEETPEAPLEDVIEVANHVAALDHALARLAAGIPLSNRLARELHGVLFSRGRGAGKGPGEYRRAQTRVGGDHPGDSRFVPPPPTAVPACMGALERFMHGDDDLPPLLRSGLAYAQLQAIQPFLDGNGRIGRLLLTLQLGQAGLSREPLLYPSLYFKQHLTTHDALLDLVRREGDWEGWLAFFVLAVQQVARHAFGTAERAAAMFRADRARIQAAGRGTATALRVHEALKARPLLSQPRIREETGLPLAALSSAMDRLVALGVAREREGKRRLLAYEPYLAMLEEEA